MSVENKYPCIVNRSEQTPTEYIGIVFNGDQRVYRKATVKALKKSRASKTHISAVKVACGDLEISRILIEADLFDVLVDVFNSLDARTVVLDYIDSLYGGVVDEANAKFNSSLVNHSKSVKKLGEEPDINAVLAEVDKIIDEQFTTSMKKLTDVHTETARTILDKFFEACARKKQRLNKKIQNLQGEQARLEAIVQKIS